MISAQLVALENVGLESHTTKTSSGVSASGEKKSQNVDLVNRIETFGMEDIMMNNVQESREQDDNMMGDNERV